jgi:hypothetical protein
MSLFDHALQRFPLERAAAAVEDDGDSPSVGMIINLVRPASTIEREPIPGQGGNDFASSSVAKLPVVDSHGSDGNRDARLNTCLDLIGRLLGNALSMLKHALDDQADDFIDVLKRFVLSLTPG